MNGIGAARNRIALQRVSRSSREGVSPITSDRQIGSADDPRTSTLPFARSFYWRRYLRTVSAGQWTLASSGWITLLCMESLAPGSFLRTLVVFGFVFLCPGLAVTNLVPTKELAERWVLVVALSMSLGLLVSVAFTVVRDDSVALRIGTLAVLTTSAVIADAVRGRLEDALRSSRPTRSPRSTRKAKMTTIPILLYHSVSADPASWIAHLAVTPQVFAAQIDGVVESGRTPMTVTGLREALCGRAALPPRPVVLTFDDGFADFATAAAILAAKNIPSTLYVTTGSLGGRGPAPTEMALPPAPMLDWSQLAEMEENGVEIGAHTHTHPQLDTLRTVAAVEEIRRSKQMLEDELGHAVTSFAYPYGYSSARVRRAVEAAGYTSACAVMNALSSGSDRVFSLARLLVGAAVTPEELSAWLAGRGAPVAPYPERSRTKLWRGYRQIRATKYARRVIGAAAPEPPRLSPFAPKKTGVN